MWIKKKKKEIGEIGKGENNRNKSRRKWNEKTEVIRRKSKKR